MSLLLILLVVVILLACCGGGFYGSRSGWWGNNRNNAPIYGDPNPTPFANGSNTQPSPGGVVQGGPYYPPQSQYVWNPLYTVILLIIVIFLIAVLLSFLGGVWHL